MDATNPDSAVQMESGSTQSKQSKNPSNNGQLVSAAASSSIGICVLFDLASKPTGGLIWDKRNIFYQEFDLIKNKVDYK